MATMAIFKSVPNAVPRYFSVMAATIVLCSWEKHIMSWHALYAKCLLRRLALIENPILSSRCGRVPYRGTSLSHMSSTLRTFMALSPLNPLGPRSLSVQFVLTRMVSQAKLTLSKQLVPQPNAGRHQSHPTSSTASATEQSIFTLPLNARSLNTASDKEKKKNVLKKETKSNIPGKLLTIHPCCHSTAPCPSWMQKNVICKVP